MRKPAKWVYDFNRSQIPKKTVLEAEDRLISALLALTDRQIFDLFALVDFGDDVEQEDDWLEDMGIGLVPDRTDAEGETLVKEPIVPSLHLRLEARLRGKKRHGNLVWIAVGLATLVTDVATEGMPDSDSVSSLFDELVDLVEHAR